MRKPAVIGIAAFACFVLAGVFLLSERGAESPALDLPHDDAAPAVERSSAARTESRAETEIRPIAAMPFVEPESRPAPAESEPELLRVLVIEDSTGLPVPGAEVTWRDREETPEELRGAF